jgi:hypothetical protein
MRSIFSGGLAASPDARAKRGVASKPLRGTPSDADSNKRLRDQEFVIRSPVAAHCCIRKKNRSEKQ